MSRQLVFLAAVAAAALCVTLRSEPLQPAAPRPQGWAVRASLSAAGPLYNPAKQKLLDVKQERVCARFLGDL